MRTIRTIQKTFTPREAAKITGVSVDLQRDWRRRGFLERRDVGVHKFELTDIIRMTVMRAFTQSGMPVSTANTMASIAVLPTLSELHFSASEFWGDPVSEDEEREIIAGSIVGGGWDQQWTFAALPIDEDSPSGVGRCKHLETASEAFVEAGAFHGIVLNHISLATHIRTQCDGPVVIFEVRGEADG